MLVKDKKTIQSFLKIISIFIVAVILIFTTFKTFSRYESNSTSNGNIEVAFYMLKDDYQSMSTNLPQMAPSDEPYIYSFTIANNDGTHRTQTKLEYDLTVETTTNIPLTYDLFMNEDYKDVGSKSIISENVVEQDEDGMFIRKLKTPTNNFGFTDDEVNTYTLVIYFPKEYKTINYQNLIENIEIKVNSKQIIEQE